VLNVKQIKYKIMKTLVVSTSNENHFFSTRKEAKKDMQWGIDTLKKLQIKDTVYLYEMPSKTNDDLTDQEHFINCLSNNTAKELKKEEVK